MTSSKALGLALIVLAVGIGLCVLYEVYPVDALPPGGHSMSIDEADQASLHDPSVHDIKAVERPPCMAKAMEVTGRFFASTFARIQEHHDVLEVRLGHYSQPIEDQTSHEEGIGYTSLQLFEINADETASPSGAKVELPPGIVFLLGDNKFKCIDRKRKLTSVEYAPFYHPTNFSPANQANLIFLETNRSVQRPLWDRSLTVVGNIVYNRLLLYFANAPGWSDHPSRPVRE